MKKYKGEGRVVNYKKEEYEVFIGRGDTSLHHYGNPFVVNIHGSRKECVVKFRRWLLERHAFPTLEPLRRQWILENVEGLRGKVLGCFCDSPPCHGYVLLELAEREHAKNSERRNRCPKDSLKWKSIFPSLPPQKQS